MPRESDCRHAAWPYSLFKTIDSLANNISDLKKQPLNCPPNNDRGEGLPQQQQQSSSYSASSQARNHGQSGHSRKYSSASTLAIHEGCSSLEAFEQLVKKYNLFVYLPHIEPPPGYDESNSYPASDVTREGGHSQQSSDQTSSLGSNSSRLELHATTIVTMDDGITVERQGGPIETVSGTCGVPARLTGFISLVIQAVILIISVALAILFFFHVGGYAYFSRNVATILGDNATFVAADTTTIETITSTMSSENGSIIEANLDEAYTLLDKQNQSVDATLADLLRANSTEAPKLYNGPFLQIQEVQFMLFGVDWDLLAIIRALCSLYVVICALWLISLLCLLLSLKLEILDFVCVNVFCLTVAFIFQLVLAILICVLLFYHHTIDSLLYLISGTVGGLLLCFIFGVVALVMACGWYRYIDYMNGSEDSCLCTSTIVRLIKRTKRPNRGAAQADYSIPEATRHANLPYIDEAPVQQFSNF